MCIDAVLDYRCSIAKYRCMVDGADWLKLAWAVLILGTSPAAWMVAVLVKTLLVVVAPSLTWNDIRVTEPIGSGPLAVQVIVLSAVLTFNPPLVAFAELATRLVALGIVSVTEAFEAGLLPVLSRLSA